MDLGYSSIASSRRQSIGDEPDYKKVMVMSTIVMSTMVWAMRMIVVTLMMMMTFTPRMKIESYLSKMGNWSLQ